MTATDADGNTSEFSAEQTVAAPVIPAQPLGNRGIYFDGVDDKVVTNTFSLNDFTIEFWIKTKQTGSASADPNWYNGFGLVDADQSGSGDDFGVSLADGKIRFGIANIATAETTLESNATPLVNDGAWHHIAAVRNNTTNTLQIYIDGVLNNSTTAVATGAVGVAPLTFGASANSGGFFNGQLDEVRVFNTVRTAAQIATDMAAQAANGAVAYWNLDQSTGTTANDLSGNANNGTLQNGTLWALRVTDNTDNSGAGLGSLRQAITEANTDTDTDYIDFSIQQANTATVSTITMADLGGGIQNALPVITESIFIDGYSAYGSSPNTANFLALNNAQIRIELDCQYIGIPPNAMPPLSSGLELNASNST
ncbi:MAG: LamG domain-containing protein [Runella slithyformis]|nr:MAG: LamG domain-containing protein [Runella slithyformis]